MRSPWNQYGAKGCGHQRVAPHKLAVILPMKWTCVMSILFVDVPLDELHVKGPRHHTVRRAHLHMFGEALLDLRIDALGANVMKKNHRAHWKTILPDVHAIKLPLRSEHVDPKAKTGVDDVPHL